MDGPPNSSHAMELRALRRCLEEAGLPRHPMVVLWVTDSTSAALSVNKGNCRSPDGYAELESVFGVCDSYGYELLAMWAPREDNVLADYLSHLSALLNRREIRGRVAALEAAVGSRSGNGESNRLGTPGSLDQPAI